MGRLSALSICRCAAGAHASGLGQSVAGDGAWGSIELIQRLLKN